MVVAGPKADCLTRVLGLWNMGGCLLRILRDPNPYLREIRRKPQKTPNDEIDKHEEDSTWHFPSTSFEHRTAQPLVGPRTDSLTSMPSPGFEPRTFGSAGSFIRQNNWHVLPITLQMCYKTIAIEENWYLSSLESKYH